MNTHKIFLFIFTLFTIFSLQVAVADEKLDLSTSIKTDDPSAALSLTKVLKHSPAKYGNIQVDTYYSFGPPKFTLLGFELESCTITLFENKIGHIYFHYKGAENNIKLNALLTEALGESTTIIGEDPIVRWTGKNEFHYELLYVDYSKTYSLSITNDTYRKFNKAYNGG